MTQRAVAARPRHLLARLLSTPDLDRVVPSLDPRVLHQLVRHVGLEECREIVALATPQQLTRIFDDDLWQSDTPGREVEFDADRFGLWLEVLADADVAAAAEKIAAMDFDFVTAAVSRHVLVLDEQSMMAPDAEEVPGLDDLDLDPLDKARAALTESAFDRGLSQDLGGYRLVSRRSESWDALVSILIVLEQGHHGFFDRLMRRCSHLVTEYVVDNAILYDVLTSDEQVMADSAGERERRREEDGFVSESQAVAFLKLAREPQRSGSDTMPPPADPVTRGYFRELDSLSRLRDREGAAGPGRGPGEGPAERTVDRQVSAFMGVLQAGGVIAPPRPQLLLEGKGEDGGAPLGRIRAHLRFVKEHDASAYARRCEELAYLANVLIAGCSYDSRRFRADEGADAALAVCNLGLENWRPAEAGSGTVSGTGLPAELLVHQDLVSVFRNGWNILHEEVGLQVAGRLAAILSDLRCDDHDVQGDITDLSRRLRAQVAAGTPWRERDNIEVVAILDQPAWATLLGLLDQCPVVPKAREASGKPKPLRVDTESEFISENRQIVWVRDFLESLPARLTEP